MKTEALLKHIQDMGYEYCAIEQNKVPVCRFTDCNSSQALVKKMRMVLKQIEPGTYVFVLRNKTKGPESTNVFITATIDGSGLDGQQAMNFNQAPIDIAKLREEIKAELRAEEAQRTKEQEYKERIDELEEELRVMRSPMERLAGAGMLLLQNTPLGKQLFNMPGIQLNGSALTNDSTEEYSDEEDAMIENALDIVLKHLTPQELHTLAQNVDARPELIDTLRTFKLI